MSDTPRTDKAAGNVLDGDCEHPQDFDRTPDGSYVTADFARQLEREVAILEAENERLRTEKHLLLNLRH